MPTAESIAQKISKLPASLQDEVVDFIDFIIRKNNLDESKLENGDWSEFSLNSAMKGMENEDFPKYTEADLKEKWQ